MSHQCNGRRLWLMWMLLWIIQQQQHTSESLLQPKPQRKQSSSLIFKSQHFASSSSESASSLASFSNPKELVSTFLDHAKNNVNVKRNDKIPSKQQDSLPLATTILCGIPSQYISPSVSFYQKDTNTRINGYETIQSACIAWDKEYYDDSSIFIVPSIEERIKNSKSTASTGSGSSNSNRSEYTGVSIERISSISPMSVIVQWNITWVPIGAKWLLDLSKITGFANPSFNSYTNKYDQITTFSYRAVAQLFIDAIQTGRICIPLACIKGMTTLNFASQEEQYQKHIAPPMNTTNNKKKTTLAIVSIIEELDYANDLQRGRLQNRKCAMDLQLFLECLRRPPSSSMSSLSSSSSLSFSSTEEEEWESVVSRALPWQSVPGMNPLDIVPQDDDPAIAIGFVGVTIVFLVLFSILIAPEFLL